jgi:hypothetical protein
MKRITTFVAMALLLAGCSTLVPRRTEQRRVLGTYSLWSGMGPPISDRRFPEFSCKGTFLISNVDVSFTAGESKGCHDPRQLRVTGTLPYSELREIRVMKRPEVLIFKTGAEPPVLRVTDWVSGNDFQRAVRDLRTAYQGWKSHHRDTK